MSGTLHLSWLFHGRLRGPLLGWAVCSAAGTLAAAPIESTQHQQLAGPLRTA